MNEEITRARGNQATIFYVRFEDRLLPTTHTPLIVPSLFLVTASGSSGVNVESSTPPSSSGTGESRPPAWHVGREAEWNYTKDERRHLRKGKSSIVVTLQLCTARPPA